jgi:hypothetical protein
VTAGRVTYLKEGNRYNDVGCGRISFRSDGGAERGAAFSRDEEGNEMLLIMCGL